MNYGKILSEPSLEVKLKKKKEDLLIRIESIKEEEVKLESEVAHIDYALGVKESYTIAPSSFMEAFSQVFEENEGKTLKSREWFELIVQKFPKANRGTFDATMKIHNDKDSFPLKRVEVGVYRYK